MAVEAQYPFIPPFMSATAYKLSPSIVCTSDFERFSRFLHLPLRFIKTRIRGSWLTFTVFLRAHQLPPFKSRRTRIEALESPQMLVDMASIAPPSKKRAREVDVSSPIILTQDNMGQPIAFNNLYRPIHCRHYGSVGTSTTERSALPQDAVYQLHDDVETLVYLHSEQLRTELQEAAKRHCKELLSVGQQQVLNMLKEKEMEIARAYQINANLVANVQQLAVESQFWFNIAKNNEAIMCNLRAMLDQPLNPSAQEGSADSGVIVNPAAQDAGSCCHGVDESVIRRSSCRSCEVGEVSVLLLPCRHLCLCKDCESLIEMCPVCHLAIKACLRVAM